MKKQAWFHNLGFFSNPFSIKPSAFHDEIEGNESLIKKINSLVAESNMLLICGEYGSGKTSILKKVIHEFKGKKQIIYYNCNASENAIPFDKLLINAGGLLRKIFRVRKKNMILLIDEIVDINKKDLKKVKWYHEDGFFKSVVFVSKYEDIKFSEDIEELAGKNTFIIKGLDKTDAVVLVRKRIGDIEFLSDDKIAKIFSKNRNPRALLKNCEEVCRLAFESEAEKVTDAHIKEALG